MLVSVIKMATFLEEYNTEEQLSVVRVFAGKMDSVQRILIKKYFFVYGGKCLSRKAVHN
jgi:hypothetical protein